jgi:hypothetical protein
MAAAFTPLPEATLGDLDARSGAAPNLADNKSARPIPTRSAHGRNPLIRAQTQNEFKYIL